jgi:hypothetical protein
MVDRIVTLLCKMTCFNFLIIAYKHKNFIRIRISKLRSIITKKKYQGLYSTIILAETATQQQHTNRNSATAHKQCPTAWTTAASFSSIVCT